MNGFEHVYMVWDYYDGPRSGVADYGGVPHYFDYEHDAGGYADIYRLWAIDEQFLFISIEQWRLYRAWERLFHSGEVSVDTHPGHGGRDARYDELQTQIDRYLQALGTPAHRVHATFRAREEQPDLPNGCVRELDVSWRAVP